AATGATMIINDVMQDPAPGGGTASGSVAYTGAGTTIINSLNTYSGNTDLNSGGTTSALQFNHSYNAGDPSGPFGTGIIRGNSSTNLNLQPVGGTRTLANPIQMGAGGFTVSNATGDTSSLTLTGPI